MCGAGVGEAARTSSEAEKRLAHLQRVFEAKEHGPVRRGDFKGMLSPIIREVFDLGLRNDTMDPGSKHQTAGWKGIRPVQEELTT